MAKAAAAAASTVAETIDENSGDNTETAELLVIQSIKQINAQKSAEDVLGNKSLTTCIEMIAFFQNSNRVFDSTSTSPSLLNEEDKVKFVRMLVDAVKFLNEKLLSEESLKQIDEFNEDTVNFGNILTIIVNWTNSSFKFSSLFQTLNGLAVLFDILCNKKIDKSGDRQKKKGFKIIDKLIKYEMSKHNNGTLKHLFVRSVCNLVLSIVMNLSKIEYKFAKQWQELVVFDFLVRTAEKLRAVPSLSDFYLCCYVTLANIYDDKDLKKMDDLKLVIKSLSELTGECAANMEKKNYFRRAKVIIDTDNDDDGDKMNNQRISEVALVVGRTGQGEWHLYELIQAIYNLAVNDQIKKEIYYEFKLKYQIRSIVLNGNEVEKEIAMKLLWQLCFNKEIALDVKHDEKLFEFIAEKAASRPSSSTKHRRDFLLSNCQGIFWLIKKHEEKINQTTNTAAAAYSSANNDQKKQQKQQIMISYNHESRETCLRIRDELEKQNFRVWIDVDDIHGSSLESMANAVEQSACVLICMTEKYKQSPYCRAEAEYTFQLKKAFVPLIMQPEYKPNGWLGIILGSKIYIDFTKSPFNDCIDQLKKELKPIFSALVGTDDKNVNENKKITDKKSNSTEPRKWSNADVLNWTKEKNFSTLILENILPCDGELLYQMFTILESVPEFYYNSLNANGQLPLRESAHFTCELKKLFI